MTEEDPGFTRPKNSNFTSVHRKSSRLRHLYDDPFPEIPMTAAGQMLDQGGQLRDLRAFICFCCWSAALEQGEGEGSCLLDKLDRRAAGERVQQGLVRG